MTDFRDIKGQETAKRAVEIALVGNHSILLSGNRGQGKTMLTNAAAVILRTLADDAPVSERRYYAHFAECHPTADYLPDEAVLRPAWSDARACMMGWPVDLHPYDMLVDMGDLSSADFLLPPPAETTAMVLPRVIAARKLPVPLELDVPAVRFFHQAAEAMRLCPKHLDSAISVAGSVARLAGKATIGRAHLAEALSYIPRVV